MKGKHERTRFEMATDSQEGEDVAALVKKLPDEEPDLVWRSRLNERLLQTRQRGRRPAKQIWALGAIVVACTCAFALYVFRGDPTTPSLESRLVTEHERSVGWGDLVGSGLTFGELRTVEGKNEELTMPPDLEAL